jgi:hypothetical protein
MIVVKVSALTDKTHSREIDVTQDQINRWQASALIQHAMPHLSRQDREYLMTGTTQEEWDAEFDIQDDAIRRHGEQR